LKILGDIVGTNFFSSLYPTLSKPGLKDGSFHA
jgi:hypothetical protein